MKSRIQIFFLLIFCALVAIAFINDDEAEVVESTAIEHEVSAEPTEKNTAPSSNQGFLESSWSKVRQSITSLKKRAMPTKALANHPPSQNIQNNVIENPPASAELVVNNKNDFSTSRNPLTNSEIQSINDMTKVLSRAIAKNLTSHQFMQILSDSLKLHPQFLDEGSSSIGSMVTVRTHDALEGTRYLHTQFTGEKNKADFLQHASFQIRPGPDSFAKAVEALNQVLPDNKKLKESSSDYVLYSTGDGYVAWIKVADLDDLKSNDYNKASAKDVGAVIVTIEQEIHGSDEDHTH